MAIEARGQLKENLFGARVRRSWMLPTTCLDPSPELLHMKRHSGLLEDAFGCFVKRQSTKALNARPFSPRTFPQEVGDSSFQPKQLSQQPCGLLDSLGIIGGVYGRR
jgi:hypothetical protein